ncbi:hypothetical protein BDU57DRAFT_511696 [Ampelomyces quisqualis]|uniref:Uncharacterized protein n=1 Tax=Ampelomyces quisqualis TaxID=50730 RepID=A0A6A5QTY2_AMPQU|nr:hypothetical protein BDU57DRAFT_511696 [Ampelomyces quisqualis]
MLGRLDVSSVVLESCALLLIMLTSNVLRWEIIMRTSSHKELNSLQGVASKTQLLCFKMHPEVWESSRLDRH